MRTPLVSTRLREQFLQRIRSGQWQAAATIPTESQLMDQYGASRTAVRSALKQLEERGLLRAVQGRGREVTPQSTPWSATIGILAVGSDLAAGQNNRFFVAIDHEMSRLGHTLLTYAFARHNSFRDPRHRRGWDLLDGAILYSLQYHSEIFRPLAKRIPMVSMPHNASGDGIPSFFIDYGLHAAVAVRELAAAGHHHIALVMSDQPHIAGLFAIVRRGFDLGRLCAGLPPDAELVMTYPGLPGDEGYGELYEQLRQLDPSPTAIVTRSSMPMLEMLRLSKEDGSGWAQRRAMVCLGDLSNDTDLAAPLIHFAVDVEQIAREGVACLQGMLHGSNPERLDHPFYGRFTVPEGAVLAAC